MFVVCSHHQFFLPVFDQGEKGLRAGCIFLCFQSEETDNPVSEEKQGVYPSGKLKNFGGYFFRTFAGRFPDLENILIINSSESRGDMGTGWKNGVLDDFFHRKRLKDYCLLLAVKIVHSGDKDKLGRSRAWILAPLVEGGFPVGKSFPWGEGRLIVFFDTDKKMRAGGMRILCL